MYEYIPKVDMEDEPGSDNTWISWFCELEGHEFFCAVDEDYIADNFNLYGLRSIVPKYPEALNMILNPRAPTFDDFGDLDFCEVYQSAFDLYGLIHSRFILTPRGLEIMKYKYVAGIFGVCPRTLCQGQSTLPIGLSDELNKYRVKIYCPKCEDVYHPKLKKELDGVYFGTAFPHMFLQMYPELVPKEGAVPFIPRIYGFRIYRQRGSKYQVGSTYNTINTSN